MHQKLSNNYYDYINYYANKCIALLQGRPLGTYMVCPLLYSPYKLNLSNPYAVLCQQKENYGKDVVSIHVDLHTKATFKALVDAIVPKTPGLAEKSGEIQFFGALNLHTDEYEIWSLDHYLALSNGKMSPNIPLAGSTAKMLDIAAMQLIFIGANKEPVNFYKFPGGGAFAALGPSDRFRVITLLEQLKVNPACLPVPFRDNPGFVPAITDAINRLAMLGYYTEWPGYGSTRLETPDKRKLECFPTGWKQAGYPGPSKGYHALRGYLVEKFTD